MFLEPHFKGQRSGWIEVICGSMFSGKTEELIRRLKRAKFAKLSIKIFKPIIDGMSINMYLSLARRVIYACKGTDSMRLQVDIFVQLALGDTGVCCAQA